MVILRGRLDWAHLPAPQIEAIFELGDVDGDGEIDMGEFVGLCPRNSV